MDNFNYKEYLKSNPLLNENMEDEDEFYSKSNTISRAYDYERGIVKDVIDNRMDILNKEDIMTREYINGIIAALEDLKVNDF